MKAKHARSTLDKENGTTIVEYALMLALIAAICAGAVYTMEDLTPHLGVVNAETTVP